MDQQEHFEQEARQIGEYIALLLEAAEIPEAEKISFATLLPKMDLEQMQRLITMLETNIQSNGGEIEGLKEKLDAINEQYARKEEAIIKQTLKNLDEIEQFVKNQEPNV